MKDMNYPSNTLIYKNVPKAITNVGEFLQTLEIPAKFVKPFGRRRVLITYEHNKDVEKALELLNGLEINGKQCHVAMFLKDKPPLSLLQKQDHPQSPAELNDVKNTITKKTAPKRILKIHKAVQTVIDKNGPLMMAKTTTTPLKINKELRLVQTVYVAGNRDDGDPNNANNTDNTNNTANKTSPSTASSSKPNNKLKMTQQVYDYIICVDFEATCWENKAPPRWRESEIIEFPAVLINLKTGEVEAEFHKYVMPIESPKLSEFCTKLTGITQKTVDNGIPLQTALMMFQEWLRKELRARHLVLPKMTKDNKTGNCALVSWTDWDFGICLHKECARKRLRKAPYFNQWIDLRAIYKKWYKYQPLNFGDALRHVGLTFEGREHSGIDDAKNLATLAYKLVNDGATLALTQDLTPFQMNTNCVL